MGAMLRAGEMTGLITGLTFSRHSVLQYLSSKAHGLCCVSPAERPFGSVHPIHCKEQDMANYRIEQHPILPIEPRESVAFYWQGQKLTARQGETIASALFANRVRVFGH